MTSDFIKIQCLYCDKHLRIPQGYVGRTVKCPKCGKRFEVGQTIAHPPDENETVKPSLEKTTQQEAFTSHPVTWTDKKLAKIHKLRFSTFQKCPNCGSRLANKIDEESVQQNVVRSYKGGLHTHLKFKRHYVCIQCNVLRCQIKNCNRRATQIYREFIKLHGFGLVNLQKDLEGYAHEVWICDLHAPWLRNFHNIRDTQYIVTIVAFFVMLFFAVGVPIYAYFSYHLDQHAVSFTTASASCIFGCIGFAVLMWYHHVLGKRLEDMSRKGLRYGND